MSPGKLPDAVAVGGEVLWEVRENMWSVEVGNWHRSIEIFGYMLIQTYVAAYLVGTRVSPG